MTKNNKGKKRIRILCIVLIIFSYCLICTGVARAEETEVKTTQTTENTHMQNTEASDIKASNTETSNTEVPEPGTTESRTTESGITESGTTEPIKPDATTAGAGIPSTQEAEPVNATTEEPPIHAPKVLVSGCTMDTERLEPGMDATFQIILYNTSQELDIYNMKLTYESESGELQPLDTTNSQYVSKLKAGGSITQSVRMHIPKDLEHYGQKLLVSMEYEDENAVAYTASEQVFLMIYRPLSFHADQPNVPLSVESGQRGTMTVELFNTGKATIYNVCCKLECRGFLESESYYIGTMNAESNITATLSPIATNRQYGALGDKNTGKYGSVQGKIIITYEDELGNVYTDELTVRTEITRPADEVEEPKIETVEYSSQWWISAVVLLLVINILVIVAAYYTCKHRV